MIFLEDVVFNQPTFLELNSKTTHSQNNSHADFKLGIYIYYLNGF